MKGKHLCAKNRITAETGSQVDMLNLDFIVNQSA